MNEPLPDPSDAEPPPVHMNCRCIVIPVDVPWIDEVYLLLAKHFGDTDPWARMLTLRIPPP